MLHLLIGLMAGVALAVQSSANSRLRRSVGSPLMSSLISFAIGTVLLGVAVLVKDHGLLPTGTAGQPWWIWSGGALGVVFLTMNLLLLPRIGAVETGVFPLVGQVVMGLVIDNFGLFSAPRTPLTALRGGGALLVLVGAAVVAVAGRARVAHGGAASPVGHWPLRLAGVGAGALSAAQTAINGHLGVLLHSGLKAAGVSFTIGTLALLLVNMAMRARPMLVTPSGEAQNPWWMWTGGLLGAIYVTANATLAPAIGAGMTVVLGLTGMTAASVVVDHFGLLQNHRRPTTWLRLAGLLVLLAGVAAIRLL